MYAVVDVETTGVVPGLRHRVNEVAVVLVDEHGSIEDEWCTLVNPERDLGPQHIHGIRAADARGAPTFDRIAAHLAELLRGRAVVAHNLPFDVMFLRHEYGLLGFDIPLSQDTGLCTMRLAAKLLPGAGRTLRHCCVAASVSLDEWHSALDDARAVAGLLQYYLTVMGRPVPWRPLLEASAALSWPSLPACGFSSVRRGETDGEAHFLARIVERMPRR